MDRTVASTLASISVATVKVAQVTPAARYSSTKLAKSRGALGAPGADGTRRSTTMEVRRSAATSLGLGMMCYELCSVAMRFTAALSEGEGSMRRVDAPLQNGSG